MPYLNSIGIVFAASCLLLASIESSRASALECREEAREQARDLLTFHIGEDDRIWIREEVESLGKHPNPAAPEESLETLEVWADVYKGRYRMRFQYAHILDGCLLMGQEILEFADLGMTPENLPPGLYGTVLALTAGDRACYLRLETWTGEVVEQMASFELCEQEALIGQRVILRRERQSVMAASCEGDPECPDVEWVELVVEAVPE